MRDNVGEPVIHVNRLFFSYEVAQNINSQVVKKIATEDTSKPVTSAVSKATYNGGLSVALPRQQYQANEELVYKVQLRDVCLDVPRGARCLLVGSNGSGKSTLLNILGGKHMISEGDVRVLGRKAFEDTALTNEVALLTGNWTRTVAFVGHNVPYQAMNVSTLVASQSAGVDPARVHQLRSLLGVDLSWNLTAASDGQRRRVQIMLKLLRPFKVLLLDEITTDLDLLVRARLLAWLAAECEDSGVTVVYCTHIFDGLDGWATHVAHVEQTKLRLARAVEDVPELSEQAWAPADGAGILFRAVQSLLASRPEFGPLLEGADAPANPPSQAATDLALEIRNLSWAYAAPSPGAPAPRPAIDGLTASVGRGERVLLTGGNGAGKTTLLRILGGKHLVTTGTVRVQGHDAFADVTTLNTKVALLTGDWSRTVACVGSGVPYQADFSAEFMASNVLAGLKAEAQYDAAMLDQRLAKLERALDIDGTWRMNAVSDGQRRRIQILLKLLRPVDVLFMDEVTTDLDVLARQSLLAFLKQVRKRAPAPTWRETHADCTALLGCVVGCRSAKSVAPPSCTRLTSSTASMAGPRRCCTCMAARWHITGPLTASPGRMLASRERKALGRTLATRGRCTALFARGYRRKKTAMPWLPCTCPPRQRRMPPLLPTTPFPRPRCPQSQGPTVEAVAGALTALAAPPGVR